MNFGCLRKRLPKDGDNELTLSDVIVPDYADKFREIALRIETTSMGNYSESQDTLNSPTRPG